MSLMKLAARFKEVRQQREMSLSEVAAATGIE